MTASLNKQAKALLQGNDLGGFTVPTKGLYPYQWNWDSAFSALGFAEFDQPRAWQELQTLLDSQWECGFVPHIVFRKNDPSYFPGPDVWSGRGPISSSGISNPPIATIAAKKILNDFEEPAELNARSVFPKLLKWHRWFKESRDFNGLGVVISVHPWEGGRDNSPEWDQPASAIDTTNVGEYQRRDIQLVDAKMRPHKYEYDRYVALVQYGLSTGWDHKKIAQEGPYRVVDVGMTMMLLRANRDLLWMAEYLGETDAATEIKEWICASESGVDWLWNPHVNSYCSRDAITGESSSIVSNASFLNFFAGVGSTKQHQAVIDNIEAIDKTCEYLMPSLGPQHAEFDHLRYWRGPIWLVMNYMISVGLAEFGFDDLAQKVRSDSARLIKKSGFCEAFSPMTGQGTGGSDFSWSAAIWLAWAQDQDEIQG